MAKKEEYASCLIYTAIILFTLGVAHGEDGEESNNNIQKARWAQFPYMVRIEMNNTGWCGGVLLSEKAVITCSICVQDIEPRYLKVIAGSTYRSHGDPHDEKRVVKIYSTSEDTRQPGLAILEVDSEILIDEPTIKKINIVRSSVSTDINCTAIGYERDNSRSGVIHFKHYMSHEVTICSPQNCVGDAQGEHQDCDFEDGNALVCDGHLAGIACSNHECFFNIMNYYTDLAYYSSLVDVILKDCA